MEGIELAKSELIHNNYTCVVVQGKEVIMTSFHNGVRPLIEFYKTQNGTQKSFFSPLVLADKVIGRAAALLAVLCGITSIYTHIISEEAKRVLEFYKIPVTYEKLVPYIINRGGDGRCPMEELSIGVNEPIDMYNKIIKWLAERN
ncbi:MAG: DUF1893 domain-containing protein [Ruminiclostridium sp.]|nr:DUF1893 domain-containing protein [Ruminiclostridium sp.]